MLRVAPARAVEAGQHLDLLEPVGLGLHEVADPVLERALEVLVHRLDARAHRGLRGVGQEVGSQFLLAPLRVDPVGNSRLGCGRRCRCGRCRRCRHRACRLRIGRRCGAQRCKFEREAVALGTQLAHASYVVAYGGVVERQRFEQGWDHIRKELWGGKGGMSGPHRDEPLRDAVFQRRAAATASMMPRTVASKTAGLQSRSTARSARSRSACHSTASPCSRRHAAA